MNTRTLIAIALLASVAACKIGGEETNTGASAVCAEVGTPCAGNGECCSYGCYQGFCVANPNEGGVCATSNDCAGLRLCKSGACTTQTPGMCRDTGDVCTVGYGGTSPWGSCCSGNCEVGRCTTNQAPIVSAGPDVPDAPYTQPFTLTNGSSDPDGDPLSFGWALVSAPTGSTAFLSSPTATNPSFTPDKEGPYVVRLTVTEGPAGAPNRNVLQDEVTIVAVNRAPEVIAATLGAVTTWSRNVPVTISGSAHDPDGDALDCAWQLTGPTDTAPVAQAAPCDPSSPAFTFTPKAEGTYHVDLVVRDHDRTTGTVVHTVMGRATFTSINDPPDPKTTRPQYYANMGPTADTTPAVTLDASPSTDPNGDHVAPLALSFFWEVLSAADGGALPGLTGANTATPSFTPGRATTYVLQVRVSDQAQFGRPGASATLQVWVEVGRYVQALGHTVADSARATAVGVNRIVFAGKDPTDATKGMVWTYDTETGIEDTGVRLVDPVDNLSSGLPRLVGVTPDGTKAVVVDEGVSIWIVSLGTTPSMSRVVRPFAIADVVVPSNRYAYLFKTGGDARVRQLDLTTGASQDVGTGNGAYGAAFRTGTTEGFYSVDSTTWNDFFRFTLNNSGIQSSIALWGGAPTCGGYPAQDATAIWGTLTGSYVVSSCGQVYNGSTLQNLNAPLGIYPSHVDSSAEGNLLVAGTTSLTRFGNTLGAALGTDLLPKWALDGEGLTAHVSKAFFNAAGTKRIAVVSDTATPPRHGVVTFP